jgi:2-oxoglutarate ferredoxin oxidoreductase subunit alpha
MEKKLMKGNEAIAEAAIQAGCKHYFGYPITPQSEVAAYFAMRMPQDDVKGVFLQAESEVAAINMVYGAASTGHRVMTSSSSPGISLKLEGISYIAGAELPAVIVNIVRGGPGLGNIQPAQSDYFQSVKGGGHGDYRLIVLAPASVQEMFDLTAHAFDLADKYRNPAMILGDGNLGQMMEPVEIKPNLRKVNINHEWALTGCKGRKKNITTSIHMGAELLNKHNLKLQDKYNIIAENEVMYEDYKLDDAEHVIVAYGIMSRVAKTAINKLRENGIKAGLLRPITVWPFPTKRIEELATKVKDFHVVELSLGQMVEDVRLAVNGKKDVFLHCATGGVVLTPMQVYEQFMQNIK